MKPRQRSIDKLFHRWGRDAGLTGLEVGTALARAGFVTLHGDRNGGPTHYMETPAMRQIDASLYEAVILDVLIKATRDKPKR